MNVDHSQAKVSFFKAKEFILPIWYKGMVIKQEHYALLNQHSFVSDMISCNLGATLFAHRNQANALHNKSEMWTWFNRVIFTLWCSARVEMSAKFRVFYYFPQ